MEYMTKYLSKTQMLRHQATSRCPSVRSTRSSHNVQANSTIAYNEMLDSQQRLKKHSWKSVDLEHGSDHVASVRKKAGDMNGLLRTERRELGVSALGRSNMWSCGQTQHSCQRI